MTSLPVFLKRSSSPALLHDPRTFHLVQDRRPLLVVWSSGPLFRQTGALTFARPREGKRTAGLAANHHQEVIVGAGTNNREVCPNQFLSHGILAKMTSQRLKTTHSIRIRGQEILTEHILEPIVHGHKHITDSSATGKRNTSQAKKDLNNSSRSEPTAQACRGVPRIGQ